MIQAVESPVLGATLLAQAEQLLVKRDLIRARRAFDEAEAAGADPDRCSAGRWNTAMLDGLFEDAWRESDAIRQRGEADPYRFWQGEPIDGRRVIVRSLHGLGDAVQMFRYAGRLRARAARVMYEVPPGMVALARCFRDADQVIAWDQRAATDLTDWDVQVEITELPYLFRTSLDQLPIAGEYLHLPRSLVESTAQAMRRTERARVGVVWACGDWNPARNVPLSVLSRLLDSEDCEFWNLQGNGSAAEAYDLPLHYEPDLCEGLLPLAALIANLDLVITPDTLAAHLAGALGRPAWVMLQYAADWRWMLEREDTPWYSSLRLFRQPSPGDWQSVVESVRLQLAHCFQATDELS